MAVANDLRIPITIPAKQGSYKGTVVGGRLRDYAIYEVRLETGEIFHIEAVPSENALKWFGLVKKELRNFIPVIGGQVEKFFYRSN
jgi:hypothetical protein